MVCVQPNGQVKPDTVGTPAPGWRSRSPILARCCSVAWRVPQLLEPPDATAETKTDDGWVLTGDAGFFDDDGHLKIIDRAKDVGKFTQGGMFAPKYLENKLKFFPYIKEAVTFGVAATTPRRSSILTSLCGGQLGGKTQSALHRLHRPGRPGPGVRADPRMRGKNQRRSGARPASGPLADQALLILHKELDADDGELTRTRKVRRKFISERYGVLVEALYSSQESCMIDAQVKFEDGRVGNIRATLKLCDVQTYPLATA